MLLAVSIASSTLALLVFHSISLLIVQPPSKGIELLQSYVEWSTQTLAEAEAMERTGEPGEGTNPLTNPGAAVARANQEMRLLGVFLFFCFVHWFSLPVATRTCELQTG